MQLYIAIFIGGGLGSLCRFALSRWLGNPSGGFPLGTFVANLLACLVLALAVQYFAHQSNYSESLKSMILVGFCGGFSTFSTFSLETFRMLESGQWGLAVAYVMASTLSCLLILWIITQFSR